MPGFKPYEEQLWHYHELARDHGGDVSIRGHDLVEQDLLRQWSHEQGANSAKIRENYMWDFPVVEFQLNWWETGFYKMVWRAVCELLFALDRPWARRTEGNTEWSGWAFREVWNGLRDGDYYWYYDEDWEREYGWVLYTDVESLEGVTQLMPVQVALYKGNAIWRKDKTLIFKAEGPEGGSTEEQAALRGAGGASGSSPTTPVDIPVFPKWNDNIKEKFHRSVDREMEKWDTALDVWVTETQIALNN